MASYVADNVSIHPRAEIDDDVEIGPFCVIGPECPHRPRHAAGKQRHADGPRHARRAQPHLSRAWSSAASRKTSATAAATRR